MDCGNNKANSTEYQRDIAASLGLVDAPTPASFDSLTRLAIRIFNVPVALISIVEEDRDRQFFISHHGLPEPWCSKQETPLSHSFCQHVKRTGDPLLIRDARKHSLLKSNLAITDLNVVAYLGVPISKPDGSVLGALCIIQGTPRDWTKEDVAALQNLAECVNDEILLRSTLSENATAIAKTQRYNAMRESISAAFMCPDLTVQERLDEMLRASSAALNMTTARVVKFNGGAVDVLSSFDPREHRNWLSCRFLTQRVATSDEQCTCNDLSVVEDMAQIRRSGRAEGSYAGVPLKLDGHPYGVIEFSNPMPRRDGFSAEDLSILSMVSMLVGTNLGVFGKIEKLERSEAALLEYIRDFRSESSVVFAG